MSTAKKKRVATSKRRKTKALKSSLKIGDLLLSGLRHLVQGVTQVGGTLLLVMLTPEEDIEAAGGDVVEAINGHRCGPDCWHACDGTGGSPAERQAWWDGRMRKYREDKKAREALRKGDWRKPYRGDGPDDDEDVFEKTPENR